MKKILLTLLIISAALFTGCTKKYGTVSDYSNAMNEVKNKFGDYTIEAELSIGGKKTYVKSYIKGKLWKTEMSGDGGNNYETGALYDGKNVLYYNKRTKQVEYAPLKTEQDKYVKEITEHAEKNGTAIDIDRLKKSYISTFNPVGELFSWDLEQFGGNLENAWKLGKLSVKNNYQCRMLYSDVGKHEICINDEYGIGVYDKFIDENNRTIITNVKNIKNTPILDNEIQLPQELKKPDNNLFQGIISTTNGQITKNYKTVSEYSNAMNKVQENLGDYTIEAVRLSKGKESYIKSFIKEDLWKTEISENNGDLYDGKEVLFYDKKAKIAITFVTTKQIEKQIEKRTENAKKHGIIIDNNNKNKMKKVELGAWNHVGMLFDWDFIKYVGADLDKTWKFGKTDKKNNYQCRMLYSVDNKKEVCVSDKYGIAVYAKTINKNNDVEVINVKNIKNTPIPDSEIKLPLGVKKGNIFQGILNSMKEAN